jgi:1,2-diacylglycerol 3-alpha-glucosyltransferase
LSAVAPLRIAMLSDDFDPAATGVGIHVQTLARELVAQGQSVAIITAAHPGQAAHEVVDGLSIHRVRSRVADGHVIGTPSVGEVEDILRREKSELLHLHYFGWMADRGTRAARRLGLPQVYTFHMGVEHLTQTWPLRWLKGPLRWWYRGMCRGFDQIIVPTPALKDTLAKEDPTLKWVEAITNPVVAPKSAGAPLAPSDDFTVLYVGRLSPEKNLPHLLESFALLVKDRPDSRLLIVGSGKEEAALKRLAQTLGLDSKASFLGQKSHAELGAYYRAADVFVLPSTFETQGMVAVEAMWFEKPVLVSRDIVSAHELVTDGENGFLISSGDVAETAGRLKQLAADRGLRERLGKAGAARAQRYGPSGIAARVLALYRETMQRTRSP